MGGCHAWQHRFWKYIQQGAPDDCWEWTGCRFTTGYGALGVDGRLRHANRLSWELHYGPIPKGMIICHVCDNRRCCNPQHLFVGTYKDNYVDSRNKGRNARGEIQGSAKLNEGQVREMRSLRLKGWKLAALAERFGTTAGNVSIICRGKAWAHVDGALIPKRSPKVTMSVLATVQRLRAQGHTKARIAAEVGLGLATVTIIVCNRHPLQGMA